jgi:hypothetical protein
MNFSKQVNLQHNVPLSESDLIISTSENTGKNHTYFCHPLQGLGHVMDWNLVASHLQGQQALASYWLAEFANSMPNIFYH